METLLSDTKTDQPRIYVACLAAYNNGYLHAAWIDAAREPYAIWADIWDMLARSPIPEAEEHAIHDYEGFDCVWLSESADIGTVSAVALFIAKHGALGAALVDYHNNRIDEARDALENRYCGCHPSLAAYVQELTEETTSIPEALRYYIDYEAMARDAELNGDLCTIQLTHDEVHIFRAF